MSLRLKQAGLATVLGAVLAAAGLPAGADATPPPDPTSIWTLQDENASISTANLTDRYYTNGLRLGWTSGTNGVPDFLQGIGRVLWGNGQQRISFDLTQQIYTPDDTQLVPPNPQDRPYAGVLLGNFSLIQDQDDSRSILTLSAGVVGPGAGGEQIQNGFHDLIGQGHDLGWDYQIQNTPAINVFSERTWRLPIYKFYNLETDALPDLTAAAGTLRDYIQTGVTFRLGQGLGSDFGAPRLRPGMGGQDVFKPTQPFAWYVFAGADGQAVGYDMTLSRGIIRGGPQVDEKWGIAEAQGGLALIAFGTRLTYTQVVQTQEFSHQHGGLHQFGSLALSVRF
jgi:hypothetical protein